MFLVFDYFKFSSIPTRFQRQIYGICTANRFENHKKVSRKGAKQENKAQRDWIALRLVFLCLCVKPTIPYI
jgi:hypothetical protein